MKRTINETNRRRIKQLKYNEDNDITPRQIQKALTSIMGDRADKAGNERPKYYTEKEHIDVAADPLVQYMGKEALEKTIEKTKKAMQKAAKELDFIEAARLRDEMYGLQELLKKK